MSMVWVLFLLVVVISLANAAIAGVPGTAHIGGLFSPLTPSGHRDLAQAEHLAAFVMAINEINDKTDGIYDDLLIGTQLLYSIQGAAPLIGATEQFLHLVESFDSASLFSIVSALNNEDMLVISQLASKTATQMITTVSDSGEYYDPNWCPTISNIAALQSHEGAAIQNHLCSFASKVLLFVGTDAEDINTMSEFTDESICTLDIFANIVIRSEDSDYTEEIAHAKSFGARAFVFFLPARQVARLLEQGYSTGLFHEGITISLTSGGTVNITQYFTPEADISSLMMATFSYQYTPDYYINKTSEANAFAGRWKKQPSTIGQVVNGEKICNSALDGDGDYYMYKAIDTNSNRTVCTGLDFATYDDLGFDLQSHTGLTYDATIMAAMALDYAIKNGLNYGDWKVMQAILVDNISFNGVTGYVALSKGFSQYQGAGRSTRLGGTVFVLSNFNPMIYSEGYSTPEEFMVPTGYLNTYTHTFQACGGYGDKCFRPVFSTATDDSQYIPPPDINPTINVKVPVAYSAIIHTLAGILIFMVVALSLFVIVNRRSKVIKASQPTLLACILMGGLLGAARISVGGSDKNDGLCVAEFWVGHLAFIISIGSLFVKSYRVHRIVNTKGLRHVTFSAFQAFKLLLAILTVSTVYLIIASVVGQPGMRYLRSFKANQETHWKYCGMVYPEFQAALFGMEFIFLIFGFRICWEIRKVPDLVNESKQISTAMLSIVLVSVLIMPIIYFLGLPPDTTELIASLGFGFGAIVTLLLLFVPKVVVVYNIGVSFSRLSGKINPIGNADSSKKTNESSQVTITATEDELEKCLKGKTKEERLVICQDRLRRWQALLLDQQRALMNSTSSNVHDGYSSQVSASPVRDNFSVRHSVASEIITQPGIPLFSESLAPTGGRLWVESSNNCIHGLEVQDL
jgi:hypothetical protein